MLYRLNLKHNSNQGVALFRQKKRSFALLDHKNLQKQNDEVALENITPFIE